MSDITLSVPAPRVRLGAVVGTVLAALYAGALGGGALTVFLWGGSYWFLPREARATHPLDPMLRPGGFVGLWLGVIGLALMIVMLVYTLRKAAPRVRWLGPVPAWLRFHMICGVMAPIYVALHAGLLLPRGVVAVGFWCMVLVAFSGVFGRYVYGFFPRNAAGRVEDLDEAREALAVLREDLVRVTSHHARSADGIREAIALARDLDRPERMIGLVGMGLEARRRTRRIRTLMAATDLDPDVRRRVTRDLVAQVRLARSLAAWEVAGRLLRWWHLFHLPLAKAMYAIIAIHLFTAMLFGGVIATLLGVAVECVVTADWYTAVVGFIVVFLVIPAWWRMRKEERHGRALQKKAVAEGTHEPFSIRPWVDPSKCLGSGACVAACPEKDVLKVINGQAHLVNGSHCVGHGACVAACPVSAIHLVFGSARRGVDLPSVGPDFQSNVPGLYVAGELGGMGLIANAVTQGVEATGYLVASLPKDRGDRLDVVIVGAGPAGFGAGLAAQAKGLRYALLDQDTFGGAIKHYPRQKIVMTRSMDLPGYGRVWLKTARKEELIALFEEVIEKTGLRVDAPERVEGIERDGNGFVVTTSKRTLRTWRVILSVGRRGTPRRLGVPGEEHEKVSYRLLDPELYRHQHLLVVGGGDSAIEAACALAEQPGNRVTLSYRGGVFNRVKAENRDRVEHLAEDGAVRLVLESNVARIESDRVVLDQKGEEVVVPNDYVFVFAGGVLPTEFLAKAGLTVQTHFGHRVEGRSASTQ